MYTELELTDQMWRNYAQSQYSDLTRHRDPGPFKLQTLLLRRLRRDWGARVQWRNADLYRCFARELRPEHNVIYFRDPARATAFVLRYG